MLRFFLGFLFCISSAQAVPSLVCENNDYRLEIDRAARTASVVHRRQGGTSFEVTRFDFSGTDILTYDIEGTARALRYEGTPHEQPYRGPGYIRTQARLENGAVVYSARFLIDRDPHYTVTSWRRCMVRSRWHR